MSSNEDFIIRVLTLLFSAASLIASIFNIALITAMRKWNGYMFIISAMCLCQVIYDSSFYFYFCSSSPLLFLVMDAIADVGGLSNAIWTNILSFVVAYVVYTNKLFPILAHKWTLNCFATTVPIAIAVMCAYPYNMMIQNSGKTVYFWVRLTTIATNFGLYGLIYYRTRKINSSATSSSAQQAISILTERMVYYPIIQSVFRLPVALYQGIYGYSSFPTTPCDTSQFTLGVFVAIFGPSAGVGYLIIFLVFQPTAWSIFQSWLSYRTKDQRVHGDQECPVESSKSSLLDSFEHIREEQIDRCDSMQNYDDDELIDVINALCNSTQSDNGRDGDEFYLSY